MWAVNNSQQFVNDAIRILDERTCYPVVNTNLKDTLIANDQIGMIIIFYSPKSHHENSAFMESCQEYKTRNNSVEFNIIQ